MAEFFGFEIKRKNPELGSIMAPSTDDGTYEAPGGGFYSTTLDTDGRERTDDDLVRRYRDIAMQPECDSAIEDIVSEAIASDEKDMCVSISLENLKVSNSIKKRIREEFERVLDLLDFEEKAHDIFRRWYVDGRIYYHKVIDSSNPRKGIQQLRFIDCRKIKKMREVDKDLDKVNKSVEVIKRVKNYYLFNPSGNTIGGSATGMGVKLTADSVTYVTSGLIDMSKGHVLSYLNKAIKPVNQLRMIEDALVIYRISRAPERRIFYIDVGNLPKIKAEQYLKDVMNRYRNKLVYDASTGEIRDDRNHMSMLEDFWLPRREGGRGTEITTLPGGSNLGEIDDITYFKKKLYQALNVPMSRLEAEQSFSLGRSTEITRDELKFTKFVQRLRTKFSKLFSDVLKSQLILRGVIAEDEWKDMKEHIQYDFLQDNNFTELKRAELLRERLDMLGSIESYIGTFFSKEYVLKSVLNMNDSEIEAMRDQMNKEAGIEPEDGGVNVPDSTDGVTRYPSVDGSPIPADDVSKYRGEEPPEEKNND